MNFKSGRKKLWVIEKTKETAAGLKTSSKMSYRKTFFTQHCFPGLLYIIRDFFFPPFLKFVDIVIKNMIIHEI